jgi:hypothetical protein
MNSSAANKRPAGNTKESTMHPNELDKLVKALERGDVELALDLAKTLRSEFNALTDSAVIGNRETLCRGYWPGVESEIAIRLVAEPIE